MAVLNILAVRYFQNSLLILKLIIVNLDKLDYLFFFNNALRYGFKLSFFIGNYIRNYQLLGQSTSEKAK